MHVTDRQDYYGNTALCIVHRAVKADPKTSELAFVKNTQKLTKALTNGIL